MPTRAAALAYRAVLALFPFLLLVVGLLQTVGLDAIADWVTARAAVSGSAAQGGGLLQWVDARLQEPSQGGLLSVGALTAYWSVSGGVRELGKALAVAADMDPATGPPIPAWRWFLTSVGMAPVLVVVVVAAAASLLLTARAIETVVGWLGLGAELADLLTWLRVPVVLFVVALVLAAVYHRLVPGARPAFRSVVPGAVLAAVSWTVVSLGFSIALSTVLDYGATYGSFGAAIALLVYLQLSAAVVLAGAEMNAVLAGRRSLASPSADRTTIPSDGTLAHDR